MDPVTSNFPKMGKTNASVKNTSATATGRATSTPRAGSGVGGALEAIMAPSPRHTMERLGSIGMPATTYAPQTNPEAGMNERNVRILPGAMKYPDAFSAPVQYGI